MSIKRTLQSGTANLLGGLGNLAQGTGGLIGSLWGPAGTAIGTAGGQLAGSLLGGLSNLIRPDDGQGQQLSPMQQAQQGLLQELQQQTQGLDFEPIRAEETRRFQQEIIPGIQERFTGLGGGRSSAVNQQMAGAGADLATRLAAMRPQLAAQRAQLEQGRLGQLGGFLGGQQQLALARQQLAQQGASQAQRARISQMLGGQQNQQAQLGSLARLLDQQQPGGALTHKPGESGGVGQTLMAGGQIAANLLPLLLL